MQHCPFLKKWNGSRVAYHMGAFVQIVLFLCNGRVFMADLFFMRQMWSLLHAPICIYDEKGELLYALEDVEREKILSPEDFARIEWKYPERELSAGEVENGMVEKIEAMEETAKKADPFPYIHVESNGVAYCVMRSDKEGELIGFGKLRIYEFGDEEAHQYPYCSKNDFGTILSIFWKMLTGKEAGAGRIWAENMDSGLRLKEQAAKDFVKFQEEGRRHNFYEQELRVFDCIRRGDVVTLQKSIDEAQSREVGVLANDIVRQYKNQAICTISGASWSAIKGGLHPELAFSMADSFIRNIEENLTDPVKIEKAMQDVEFAFATAVRGLREKVTDNPLIEQVKVCVFSRIHEPVRVSEIAEEVGVTPNYLSEQFAKWMGISLKQYIIEEKISTSEQLLKYTDYSLQEISEFCAFSSQSRFSEYFQRKNGMTPAGYRKLYKSRKME